MITANEDTETIETLRNLIRADNNPNATTIETVLSKDMREKHLKKYREVLDRAKYSDQTYIKLPCLGRYCRSHIGIYTSELRSALESKEFPWHRFFCTNCMQHGGLGRLFTYWREVCPKIFQDGDLETDPLCFPKSAWEQIKEWGETLPDHMKSLYVFGETGTCKSRMMYLALFSYVVQRKMSFKVLTGGELRESLRQNYAELYDKKGSYESLCDQLVDVDVLAFDDFGQDQLTETMLSDMWSILDKRFSAGKHTIFLSNFSPQDLKLRYGNIFSMDSLVRRIEEFCTLVIAEV